MSIYVAISLDQHSKTNLEVNILLSLSSNKLTTSLKVSTVQKVVAHPPFFMFYLTRNNNQ